MIIESDSEDYPEANSKQKKSKAKRLSQYNEDMFIDDASSEKQIRTRNKSRTHTYNEFPNNITKQRPQ